jgi:NADH dehydrogenase (ubiquinone) Fe-S protein 1
MFLIKINQIPYQVTNPELTLLQQCEVNSIYIPRFCYHDRLSIAGNCRMCLVELETSVKPIIACSTSLTANMSVYTNSKTVKKIRENILEFLLINHPLDCPICDQGGECDLQDQSMVFGSDRGRFIEIKRSVEDKDFGPFVKTVMTRCIHCTRCVRFFDEVAGVPELGTMGRGRETEIGMYANNLLDSEISGNVIDLCPVGALTSKPYAFTSRPWELSSFETIDIFDSLGSNIRVDVKGNVIMRILPKLNEEVNEEWISDKIRFSYDGLRKDRLTFPLVKVRKNNNLLFNYSSWDIVFLKIKELFMMQLLCKFHIYGGELNDLFSLFLLRYWIESKNFFINFYCDSMSNGNVQSSFLLKDNITSFAQFDNFLFVNVNLRSEVSVLNTRIRKIKWKMKDNIHISYIGPSIRSNYNQKHVGLSNYILLEVLRGKHFLCNSYINAKLCIIQNYANSQLNSLNKYNDLIHVNNINTNMSELQYNFISFANSHVVDHRFTTPYINVFYLFNYNKLLRLNKNNSNYVIFHGHHGNWNSMSAHLVLPSYAYTEYRGFFINLEGRIQVSEQLTYGPASSKSSVDIFLQFINKPYVLSYLNNSYFKDLFNLFIPVNHYSTKLSLFNSVTSEFKYLVNPQFSTVTYSTMRDNIVVSNSYILKKKSNIYKSVKKHSFL